MRGSFFRIVFFQECTTYLIKFILFSSTFDSHNVLSPELREAPITDDPVWFLKKKTGEVSRSWGKNK